MSKVHRSDKEDDEIMIKKPTSKNYNKLDLIYNSKYTFYEYHGINGFNDLSFESKYNDLVLRHQVLKKFDSPEPHKGHTKEKKSIVNGKVSKLYNEILEIYFDQYNNFSVAKTKRIGFKHYLKNFFLEDYD